MTFVEPTLNAATRIAVQFVNVCLATRETLTPDVYVEIVSPILNVVTTRPVKITNAWILASCLVELGPTVKSTITWLSADARVDSRVIPSKAAVGSPMMRFARLVAPTRIVRLVLMTGPFADASLITSEIP